MTQSPQIKRIIEDTVFSERFKRQMRFIAGPRQAGKTTLAKSQLAVAGCSHLYFNWDQKEIRARYRQEPRFLEREILQTPSLKPLWVCFDEIHKRPGWKNLLKDFFDTYEDRVRFIVTGSARLDLFRRSGDSLAGRYFMFRLNPLILAEILNRPADSLLPEENARIFIERQLSRQKEEQEAFDHLLHFSGFPEPFLAADSLFSKKWKEDYYEKIIKEDLRDLSRIHDLEKVLDLMLLLPDRIGAPLSINSLREDLEVHFSTVKTYLKYLILSYGLFELPPYARKNHRFIKKEKKIYFYDWTQARSESAQFENYAAMELKARVDFWNDSLEDRYGLFYVRTRDGAETDFLIARNGKPWLLVEAKLSETQIARHHSQHSHLLGNIPLVQVTKSSQQLKLEEKNFYVAPASRFF